MVSNYILFKTKLLYTRQVLPGSYCPDIICRSLVETDDAHLVTAYLKYARIKNTSLLKVLVFRIINILWCTLFFNRIPHFCGCLVGLVFSKEIPNALLLSLLLKSRDQRY